MTISVTHSFVSGVTDGSDAALVQPSDWNATHTLTGSPGSDTQVLFNDGGTMAGDSGMVFNKTTNKLTVDAIALSGIVASTQLDLTIGSTIEASLTATNFAPGANDGNALGVSGTAWADLFLASGAVVDFNAGDVQVTHSSNVLDVTGGTLKNEGVAVSLVGRQTIWVPAASMTPRTTNGAAATSREINGITMAVLAFDQSADEGANFSITFPKSWGAGTITYKAHWTATGGAGVEAVQFELRGGSFADSAAINTSGFGTAVALNDTWLTDDDVHVSAESNAVTLSNAAVDVPTLFEIIRDVSDDDLTADAELIGVEIFYTTTAGNDA